MKLYRVFIELCQNVARYSAERHVLLDSSIIGVGTIHIQNNDLYFKCTTVNRILSEHQNVLIKNCREINSSTKEDLKKRKEKFRKESTILDTGAHIGLIAVCLYSENQFEFDVTDNPENSATYFSITATINKT
ncbi:MAG: hypothetical protein EHM93_08190 [Bacteroidales bacterium]|nr:MAG: hypothetical protein EHM93_08190 [Bacteroidales bacterium]